MKLTILQNKLKEGLNIVERISSKSPTLPILGNVLLKAEKNFLELSTTDLEVGIRFWILSKIEKEGSVTVPAQILSSYISSLNPSSIKIEAKDKVLNLESNHIKTQIKGNNIEDFPIIPKVTEGETVSLPSHSVCQGLSQIVGICSLSTIRPEISGIYFLVQKNLLKMVATDSFRLGEKKIFFKEPLSLSKEYSLILPQKAVSHVISIFEQTDVFKVFLSPNLSMFESLMEEIDHPKIQFVSKLIEGEYPKYEEIIPKSYKTEAQIEKKEFLRQLKTAGIFAGRINEVKIGFDPKNQEIRVFCQNPDLGEHLSSLPAKIKGKESEVSFNYKFLSDGLLSIETNEILFALSEEKPGVEGPALLKPIGDESYLYVVMPIQAS